ncbi:hypothetical protein N0V90_007443 [Kalmusia sp. IMI 367209]|nr:hypothetical protein N0V90_007443 [Kalmusia sp. IMI 367209]
MDTDEPQLYQYGTPQPNNSFKRPRRSLQSSTPLSSVTESASPSPRLSGQLSLTPEVIDHINALKHLDDKQILLLLQAARSNGGQYRRGQTRGCENCKQPRESGQPTSRKASPCVKKYEIVMHDKDAWGCGFCGCLLTTWEERCEHIAMHFEEKKSKWNFTNVILGLLKQPEVSESWSRLMTQRHGDVQDYPRFTWESKKCNRLRYKLETKWDTRVFDVDKVVQETYDLAEIEPADIPETATETTPEVHEVPEPAEPTETISCKLEMDFGHDQRLHSSHGIPSDSMMDLDPVDTPQALHHDLQQAQWPVTSDMTQSTMTTDPGMGAFGGFNTNMSHMSTDFSQPVTQGFQPTWSNAGFVSTPDLVAFQPQNSYLNYNAPKEVVQVPTSQYANFGHYPRQSVPPNFMHHPSTPSTPSSRRFVPKLINIASSNQRASTAHMSEQPPPPPPKDEHTNRFSRMIMRRRPSNISQHTVVSQRDIGWNDELNWG